jgi:hypothetical protein
MTRDDTRTGAADPDDAEDPSLAAARDAWRALREPLAPGPDLDARIRAAARRASTGPQRSGGHPQSGEATAARVPAPSRGRVRRYAGWGLALAATLVGGIVLVLPPAPLAEVPLEASPQAGPASGPDAAAVVEHAPAPAMPPPDGPAHVRDEPARHAPVPAAARVAAAPAESVQAGVAAPAGQGTTAQAAAARTVAAPGAEMRAEVEATFAAPPPSVSVPSPSPSPSSASASASASAPPPVAHRAADAAPASRDDAAAIELELAELRALLRARDPTLPARLRAFLARHPAHPLARTDPALAELLARDPDRP